MSAGTVTIEGKRATFHMRRWLISKLLHGHGTIPHGQSEHGGQSRVTLALVQRGWIDGDLKLTRAGRRIARQLADELT